MQPSTPYNFINLVGNGIMRGVTVALPEEQVRDFLPAGLALGAQDLTPPGTHPVILFFSDMFRAEMTVPTLLPSMTYHEQILGVPFAYVTSGLPGGAAYGPFFFMPRLHLDNYLATIGGQLWWGFAKQLADITVTGNRFSVAELGGGRPLISLDFEPTGDYQPIYRFPCFEPLWGIMCQPIVSVLPMGMGPFFACSNFDKKWDEAGLRPLSAVVHIEREFVPGFSCGRFPAEGRTEGIDQSILGAFELKARWRQGLIYPYTMSQAWRWPSRQLPR